jgi:serine/threonine protein kinase
MGIALKHMHDQKILHRDIKTPNIFLTKHRMIKVKITTLVHLLSSLSHTHTLVLVIFLTYAYACTRIHTHTHSITYTHTHLHIHVTLQLGDFGVAKILDDTMGCANTQIGKWDIGRRVWAWCLCVLRMNVLWSKGAKWCRMHICVGFGFNLNTHAWHRYTILFISGIV